jgi:hypothetical protein
MSADLTAVYRIDLAPASAAARSFAIAQRRKGRAEEWGTQTRVAQLLRRHLPPGVFATTLENAPRNALSGLRAKQRGTRSGLPDLLIIWRGGIVFVEMKSRRGIASKAQRQIRDELLGAGVRFWWLARTPCSCLVALHR